MPSDVIGYTVVDINTGKGSYKPGAAMCNFLLADEINRASPKVQSSLLEAMEERQITVDGRTYPLEKPFVVIATQNNVGTAGTQFLPYAQMDRFMVRLSVGYPDHDAQMALLRDRLSENPLDAVEQVLTREELLAIAPVFGQKPYFLSDEFSLVDCYLAPLLWRLPQLGIEFSGPGAKELKGYMTRVFERDSFLASLTEAEREMRLGRS